MLWLLDFYTDKIKYLNITVLIGFVPRKISTCVAFFIKKKYRQQYFSDM